MAKFLYNLDLANPFTRNNLEQQVAGEWKSFFNHFLPRDCEVVPVVGSYFSKMVYQDPDCWEERGELIFEVVAVTECERRLGISYHLVNLRIVEIKGMQIADASHHFLNTWFQEGDPELKGWCSRNDIQYPPRKK